jgi:flagellin-like protein
MRKGVSPFIAVILLVAFTIGIGIVISLFLSGMIKITTETAEPMTEELLKCANARLYILGTPTCSSNSFEGSSIIEENLTIIFLQDGQSYQNNENDLTFMGCWQ